MSDTAWHEPGLVLQLEHDDDDYSRPAAPHYLDSSATVQLSGRITGRKREALRARMERPGSVGELVAAANALVAQGASFYATVETTVEARLAGVTGAWICSRPGLVQLCEAADECFHPHQTERAGEDREVYETVDPDCHIGGNFARYIWTFERVGRAWIVLVEWRAERKAAAA